MTKPKGTIGRLVEYVFKYKFRILLASLLLLAGTAAQLLGPFIAKSIIDNHITTIQLPWYAAKSEEVPKGVPFIISNDLIDPSWVLIREDWLPESSPAPANWPSFRIEQNGARFQIAAESIKGTLPPLKQTTLTASILLNLYEREFDAIIQLISYFVLSVLVGSLLMYLQAFLLQTTSLYIIRDIRNAVMGHILRFPMKFFDRNHSGRIVSYVTNDTEAIGGFYTTLASTVAVNGTTLIGILVAIALLDVRLALLTCMFIPMFYIIITVYLRFSKAYLNTIRSKNADMNGMLNETIQTLPIIQAFGHEEARFEEYQTVNDLKYRNQLKNNLAYSLLVRNAVSVGGGLITALAVWFLGGKAIEATITFGVVYAFIDYLGRLWNPIMNIIDHLNGMQRAVVAANRVFRLMDSEHTEPETDEVLPGPITSISFKSVSFAYESGKQVLKGIDFDVFKGQTVALVGQTGSGKSTIINLLQGFYEPSEGYILMNGMDCKRMSKSALRRQIGIVEQSPFLFMGDVKFNIRMYNESVDTDQISRLLSQLKGDTLVNRLPDGLDSPILERGSSLSAGQRQLMTFARAQVHSPPILILDEATSNIDSQSETLIQTTLTQLSHDRITFVIAHRLSTVRNANLILVMHEGAIVERGTHEDLISLNGRYATMYRLQLGEQDDLSQMHLGTAGL